MVIIKNIPTELYGKWLLLTLDQTHQYDKPESTYFSLTQESKYPIAYIQFIHPNFAIKNSKDFIYISIPHTYYYDRYDVLNLSYNIDSKFYIIFLEDTDKILMVKLLEDDTALWYITHSNRLNMPPDFNLYDSITYVNSDNMLDYIFKNKTSQKAHPVFTSQYYGKFYDDKSNFMLELLLTIGYIDTHVIFKLADSHNWERSNFYILPDENNILHNLKRVDIAPDEDNQLGSIDLYFTSSNGKNLLFATLRYIDNKYCLTNISSTISDLFDDKIKMKQTKVLTLHRSDKLG